MKNKILVYDDNCPLCTWYSGLFVRYGFLPEEGRQPFSTLRPSLLSVIDFNKGRNEIPLIDTTSGSVLYGIDSLLELLGQRIPFIRQAGNTRPVKWLLKRIYKLISYNRKLIVAKKCGPGRIDCSPDLNFFYRILFLVLCLLFNTALLFPIHANVLSKLSYYTLSQEKLQAAHFGLVFSNCLLCLRLTRQQAIEYLGQVNMLALTTVLLVCPLILLSSFNLPQVFITGYLLVITAIVFKEYLRRMYYANILPAHGWIGGINLLCLTVFLLFIFG